MRKRNTTENSSVRRPLLQLAPDQLPAAPSLQPSEASSSEGGGPKLTYQQLKERGFTGTRYDAELVQNGNTFIYESSQNQDPIPIPIPPAAENGSIPETRREDEKTLENSSGISKIRVHQRSLRCTPDRIRKRCQLGRAASDSSSSSGISDSDASSSSTHSTAGSDSGIETAIDDQHLEQSVQNMSLEPKAGLKLTLRMKNEHNYEVLRMEGHSDLNEWKRLNSHYALKKAKKKSRKREYSNSSSGSGGLKRLKLRLGNETMSTIDLE